ncbi:UDP-N-acetylglucosamine 1-carboxyvinyltransferase [Ginsengibacter hankyongi]|uniref:UDP-N-acetylglucosamine 1-carboxyvinyltransferase n=1 Tax=Ginsengibacter hankyongi TaxID=2607284 RepID=A0A5J5IL89_9BACT|nr:UDP-N-acetylglucosamine 1-carboxyvinyltransferase [Ginsengibacter hankyongi]KAA9041885.1 UDP-N-acetylglucosamine 1-carboxyvinyltransferase [Ginsengibacter hankyongi]
MGLFEVTGGKKLKGEITPQGAKNEALQVISAVLLSAEKITIHNIPDIIDVNLQIELLEGLGVAVERINRHTCIFDAANINIDYLASPVFRKMTGRLRGSVMLAGPMLARFKRAYVPKPGGDKIGRRRLDTHIIGFQKLGAEFAYDDDASFFLLKTLQLKGTDMLLDEPSVTGTANIIMAAVMATGTTTIYNAACEPYIQQLCKMLSSMGAKISGIASNMIVIEGVRELHGTTHTILPDMIEVGSFIGLAAMTQSDILIKNAGINHLGIIPEKFQQLGIQMNFIGDDIHIPEQEIYEAQTFLDGSVLTISDHPWPGFTPDLLSIVLVVATQAKGSVLIHQKMFESRLFFVDKIIEMGAHIVLCDPHRAVVIGIERKYQLKGIQMSSPDIRAGVALLIAALSAEGKSVIQNIEQIDRGYQNIDERLRQLGARIVRQ